MALYFNQTVHLPGQLARLVEEAQASSSDRAAHLRKHFGGRAPDGQIDRSSIEAERETSMRTYFESVFERLYSRAIMCAAGIVLQGLFVLEAAATWQSWVHWGGAVLFLISARTHADEVIAIYEELAHSVFDASRGDDDASVGSSGSSVAIRGALCGFGLRWKKWTLMAGSLWSFLVVIIYQVLVSAMGISQGGHKLENGMGLMQWIIIGSFLLYFVSYSLDFWNLSRLPETDATRLDTAGRTKAQ
eukprot:TRINITY_DN45363_c0_g1_i2.p1 TRINITY_DN45363_c0_g1~~TRINITY_DN45363_c0_g1_i2.p1  ORF type:complete len:267 (+),score=13.72 TRINITY_DN45363_c0_g1_i2:64-801(+)